MHVLRRSAGIALSLAAFVAFGVLAWRAHDRIDLRPRTDDAYLDADVVHLAPDVSGRIVRLAVRNNQAVHTGDILFVIDQEPYRLRVAQAGAELQALSSQLGVLTNQVASQNSKAAAANTQIGAAQAQLHLAADTLARLQPLLGRGFVTEQQVDQARTQQRTAQVALIGAQQQAREASQAVESITPQEAKIEAARATLALAQRDLRLTEIRAPCDGWITGLQIASGEMAAAGHPLFTIIDTGRWYAVGNFRETDLGGIAPGQHATVYVMSNPTQALPATVESLGWGVTPDEGITIEGLPRVPRSLNWVRIAQRFPVRVLLAAPPPALMRLGASAVIVVDR
jgi:multidrug efflux system membrane fusion protein